MDLDNIMVCTTKVDMMNDKKTSLVALASANLVI
jgi:hypothetical protein